MRKNFKIEDRYVQVDVIENDPVRVRITESDHVRDLALESGLPPGRGRLRLGDRYVPYFVTENASGIWVTLAGRTFSFEKTKRGAVDHEEQHMGFAAPMPGKVTTVSVQEGDSVKKGQVLVIMEAMKMEHRIEAPADGMITAVHCREDTVVDVGFNLLEFDAVE